MKKLSLFILIIFSLISTKSMSQVSDSLSYSLGVLIGENLKLQGFTDLQYNEIGNAISDVFSGNAKIDQESAQATVQSQAEKNSEKKYGAVKGDGMKFLAENATREGVNVLPSGVQYEILQEGSGPKPSSTDKVTTHYHGMLIDGTVFDSSVERNQPATFPVNGVIMGWQEILPMMPTGSKWKVFIPYDKAYGERGAGADIPPFAALIFEIELISIN